jgi:hypothetical protein
VAVPAAPISKPVMPLVPIYVEIVLFETEEVPQIHYTHSITAGTASPVLQKYFR